MRRLAALTAVFLSGIALAACSDRVNKNQGNEGEQIGTSVTTNPSTLESTGESTSPQTTP